MSVYVDRTINFHICPSHKLCLVANVAGDLSRSVDNLLHGMCLWIWCVLFAVTQRSRSDLMSGGWIFANCVSVHACHELFASDTPVFTLQKQIVLTTDWLPWLQTNSGYRISSIRRRDYYLFLLYGYYLRVVFISLESPVDKVRTSETATVARHCQ